MADADREDRNCGRDAAGRFVVGNRGKKPGTRNRATMAALELLDGQAERLTARAVRMALEGDVVALRLCIERLVPIARSRPVMFKLPRLKTASDATKATAALVGAVASGELTPAEAAELAKLVEAFTRALEVAELEVRIADIEARLGGST